MDAEFYDDGFVQYLATRMMRPKNGMKPSIKWSEYIGLVFRFKSLDTE